jgi:hypothetical protein
MYLVHQKETLPLEEVHVPRPSEGNPSAGRGTCTSSIRRKPFLWTRHMYLVHQKETLPLDKVHVEGNPSNGLYTGFPGGVPPGGVTLPSLGQSGLKRKKKWGCPIGPMPGS